MAGPAMTYSMVDYADVQGLVRFGYGRMTSASYATRARERRGCGESLVARGSGHECGGTEATADHGPADRVHGTRPD